ncbi:MAG: hypothetical protein HY964_09955 [Ignavibacteriales bacterium]|nr:hypothetical protein [Ignavibacteriales bacterium]
MKMQQRKRIDAAAKYRNEVRKRFMFCKETRNRKTPSIVDQKLVANEFKI